MQNLKLGKTTLLAAMAAAVLLLSSCADSISSGAGGSLPQPTTSSSTPSAAQNFPSELLQTPPQSTVTTRSLQLIEPMYAAIMNVDTTLDQTSVFDFYTTTLTGAGFVKETGPSPADAIGITFSRDAEKVDVIFGLGTANAFSVVASLSASSVS